MSEPVRFVDLQAQHAAIAEEVEDGFRRVFASAAFILGPDVKTFEEAFATFHGVAHCIGVGSGTDAIEMMLRALAIGAGDEVIVPANTFVATALAVLRAGARPVIVDCDDDYLLDPAGVEQACTDATRALLPVHLYGQAADMTALRAIADKRDLALLEDHAQSHGARQGSARAGALGHMAATSFYPGKNLGAYGDGGAVLTDDDTLADRVRRLRNWGSEVKYDHPDVGFSSRLDSLQAVVLAAKLKHLDAWNAARRDAAARYDALLADEPRVQRPRVVDTNEHVFHLYVVRVAERDRVRQALAGEQIEAGIHYPVPLHLHGATRALGYGKGDFPVAERLAGGILSLPMHPFLTEAQQVRVVDALKRALDGTKPESS